MTQTINAVKLKAAAEHLELVLKQYPTSEDVQGLLQALTPLIAAACKGDIRIPVERGKVPGAYNFGDGVYTPYDKPSVNDAYTEFRKELRGGLSERDKRNIEDLKEIWKEI